MGKKYGKHLLPLVESMKDSVGVRNTERKEANRREDKGGRKFRYHGRSSGGILRERFMEESETEDKYIIVKETMGQIPQLEKRYIE